MVARLLLIEDDASIARFVEFALEELPGFDATAPAVELSIVRELRTAREALAAGGWQLVISDLMLPDGSAEALLAEGWPRRTDAPPWVVFSAGLHEARSQGLAELGIARALRKPVPLAELLATIAELLMAGNRPAPAAPAPVAIVPVDPVQQHFGGDHGLYETFRADCIRQFANDLAAGDAAVLGADAAALRRVAHGLKAVLALIGQPTLSAQARELEHGVAAWTAGQAFPGGWDRLAEGLVNLGARRAP